MSEAIARLQNELAEALCELDELNECGDLEDRFDAAQRVSELEDRLSRARIAIEKATS